MKCTCSHSLVQLELRYSTTFTISSECRHHVDKLCYTYTACTVPTISQSAASTRWYLVYTLSTRCLQHVYILSTHCLHIVLILSTHCLHSVYAQSRLCLHAVYTLSTHCLHTVYTLSTHCLHCVYTLSTHCPNTVYKLSHFRNNVETYDTTKQRINKTWKLTSAVLVMCCCRMVATMLMQCVSFHFDTATCATTCAKPLKTHTVSSHRWQWNTQLTMIYKTNHSVQQWNCSRQCAWLGFTGRPGRFAPKPLCPLHRRNTSQLWQQPLRHSFRSRTHTMPDSYVSIIQKRLLNDENDNKCMLKISSS